jgi:hypothetical protein
VNLAPDSLKLAKNFVLGKVSDDYGLSKLQVVYYPRWELSKRGTIAIKASIFQQFVFSFLDLCLWRRKLTTISGFLTMMPFIKQQTRSAVSPIEFQLMKKQDEVFQQQNDNIKACKIFKTQTNK